MEMKINRILDGKEIAITLTDSEIYQAYRIQKHQFSISDMAYLLDCILDGCDDEEREQIQSILDDTEALSYVANVYEDYYNRREDGDYEYETAREAVTHYLNHKKGE